MNGRQSYLGADVPVGIWSNLFDHWFGPSKKLIHIGEIEKEILHVNRRWRRLPRLEHTAALHQNNFLLKHRAHISDSKHN